MASKCIGERREVGLDDIADDVDVDSEVLVNEDVAEASNLSSLSVSEYAK